MYSSCSNFDIDCWQLVTCYKYCISTIQEISKEIHNSESINLDLDQVLSCHLSSPSISSPFWCFIFQCFQFQSFKLKVNGIHLNCNQIYIKMRLKIQWIHFNYKFFTMQRNYKNERSSTTKTVTCYALYCFCYRW